jgi:hypothetical protein
MARISTYALDTNLVGGDKWIGTSANSTIPNATKNFSVNAVAAFLNTSGIIESQALRYTYQDRIGNEVRAQNSISFPTSIGGTVPFVNITSWMLSIYSKPNKKDVHTFYNSPLIGSTVLVTNAYNPKDWAIYLWDSSTQDVLEPLFYEIGLTYISGTGGLVDGQDYFISLLGYDVASDKDKTFIFTQAVPATTWTITHNLEKFPSVSVVNNNNILINGEVTYIDNNNVELNFSAGFAGKAYLN